MTRQRQWGIFARVFEGPDAGSIARQVRACGYETVQLNLSALGFPTLPDAQQWKEISLESIRDEFHAAGVSIWGVSASYNMAHPSSAYREQGNQRVRELIRRSGAAGIRFVTVCAGSRSVENMWAPHPDNSGDEAWGDMFTDMRQLLDQAQGAGVRVAVEPEHGIVIDGPAAVERMRDELGPAYAGAWGVILDWANLVSGAAGDGQALVLADALDRLSPHLVCVHLKDLVPWSQSVEGDGVLDFFSLLGSLESVEAEIPFIVQDCTAAEAARVLTYLKELEYR